MLPCFFSFLDLCSNLKFWTAWTKATETPVIHFLSFNSIFLSCLSPCHGNCWSGEPTTNKIPYKTLRFSFKRVRVYDIVNFNSTGCPRKICLFEGSPILKRNIYSGTPCRHSFHVTVSYLNPASSSMQGMAYRSNTKVQM